jgi:hypothetical protein
MLAAIWTDGDAAEVLFLIAAIAFFVEAVIILVSPYVGTKTAAADGTAVTTRGFVLGRFTGFCAAVGLLLVALGLLAL